MIPEMIGTSRAAQRLRKDIPRLATTHASILVLGESGVGKTLFVEHIHASGPHRDEPFQVINCRTTPERDLRLALFGGGPPELSAARKSLLELPTTILIKNIDKAAAYIQRDLAAALSGGAITRPGSEKRFPVKARLVFSIVKSPVVLVQRGTLTPTMCDCLKPLTSYRIPSLRARKADRGEFLLKLAGTTLSPDLSRAIEGHDWPGNVTELKAYLRSIAVRSPEEALREQEKNEISRMLLQIEEGREFSLSESLELIELGMIRRAFARNDGHQARTARLLGISDRDIRRKLGKLT